MWLVFPFLVLGEEGHCSPYQAEGPAKCSKVSLKVTQISWRPGFLMALDYVTCRSAACTSLFSETHIQGFVWTEDLEMNTGLTCRGTQPGSQRLLPEQDAGLHRDPCIFKCPPAFGGRTSKHARIVRTLSHSVPHPGTRLSALLLAGKIQLPGPLLTLLCPGIPPQDP